MKALLYIYIVTPIEDGPSKNRYIDRPVVSLAIFKMRVVIRLLSCADVLAVLRV